MKIFNGMKKIVKKIIKCLVFPKIIIGRTISYIISKIISHRKGVIIYFQDPERSKIIDLVKRIKNEIEMLLDDNEAYQIFMLIKKTEKINGDIAEVGVYKGGSAKLICEAKGNKTLHLFDTFEGLPNLSHVDNPDQFHKGDFSVVFQDTKESLKEYPNVHFYKGLFPFTADPIKNKRFSFAHLDVDLYESTFNCLKFFYQRMNKGGIIISHNYIDTPGVRKSFDDFFEDKPEPIIEMSGSQCLIVKL
ncbi:MAG: TylF/MycF/NovP-related O-methyltransferase [Candidatus Paceibacterota bacterium]|jgi:hypothetical protein